MTRPISLVAIAAVLALTGCGKKEGSAQAQGAAPPPMPVTVVKVTQQKVPVSLEAVGQAEGSREVEIRARVSGILERRLFQEGAPVAAGQTLFVIDARGTIVETVESWDRAGYNRASRTLGDLTGLAYHEVSEEGDRLPAFRPG